MSLLTTAATERDLRSDLQRLNWSFAASTTRPLTHALHPWPAKFVPQVPAAAIHLLSQRGDVVLDPFCGSGTTAVEARATGRGFIAADSNPLAALITQGKCEVPDAEGRERLAKWSKTLARIVTNPLDPPPIPNIGYWFDPHIVEELASLLTQIAYLGEFEAFLKTVFSSIVNRVSHQESETRYRRVERDAPEGLVLDLFRRQLRAGLEMAKEFDSVPQSDVALSIHADARTLSASVGVACAQLAVFSPPYPNSFDYHLYHRFRMFWLGFDPIAAKHSEIGAHLRYEPDESGWLEDMASALRQMAQILVPGAFAVCIVGDGIIGGRTVQSGDLLWRDVQRSGMRPFWRGRRAIPRSRKSFNLSDARLGEEDVLVFRTCS